MQSYIYMEIISCEIKFTLATHQRDIYWCVETILTCSSFSRFEKLLGTSWGKNQVCITCTCRIINFLQSSLLERPWLFDDFDAWLNRIKGKPHKCAAIFVDNSGADIILGIFPFIRDMIFRGTKVSNACTCFSRWIVFFLFYTCVHLNKIYKICMIVFRPQ